MNEPRIGGMLGALGALVLVLAIAAGVMWAMGEVAAWGAAPNWLLPGLGVLVALVAVAVAWRSARTRAAGSKGGATRTLLRSLVVAVLVVAGVFGLYLIFVFIGT